MATFIRAFRYLRYLRSRERIQPMPDGSLLSRCLGMNGAMTTRPWSALK